ncbi:MAG: flavodoxin-dependent (E)-4-hydroxy-3-methylbut-2-enyl-diphosphate synthase, partial [candidate division NC10 bacterium]|nr:flavodoxin-dependent (E)-4-hydroxy-3-methylbut-2-enyl-diphosphate synthase [candidate division NC10 bacterium]
MERRKTRQIQVGNVKIGGDAPISVQSMTKTDTRDVEATVDQIWALEAAGCELVRVAVPVKEAAEVLGKIKAQIRIPLIADIHFNYKLALIALEQGVDGLRLNPGNIGDRNRVVEIVKVAAGRRVPIRIGVNAGSLEKDLLRKYGKPTPEAMVESALRHIQILEDLDYREIKVSLKASDPAMMVEAYRMLAEKVDYPFHLGVTEAGTPWVGTIKSAVGLGTLLAEGIGDTVRVSLAADPVEEVRVGIEILKALGLRRQGLTFVACPSCGRADVDLIQLAKDVEERMKGINANIHVAVMGCLPPGEAVVTLLGHKPIEEVQEGDEVLTHTGCSRKVARTMAHWYQGDLVEVHPTGFPPFWLTPNHPVYACSRPVKRKGSQEKRPHISQVLQEGASPAWVEAAKLDRGSVLAYPILVEKEDVEALTVEGLGVIPVDEDFLTLCGYYLSEGTFSGKGGKPYQQFFYFHANQRAFVEKLREILARYGLGSSFQSRRNTAEVITHSFALGQLLEGLFGRGALAKRLPAWMLKLPHEKQRAIVRALWEGDGYVGCVRGYWRATYSTSSKALAFQVHQLLLRLGIPAFLHSRDQEGRKRNWVISVTSKPSLDRLFEVLGLPFTADPAQTRMGQVALDDRFLYVGVRRIRRVPYTGQVYNLEVEVDHSFAIQGAAAHNCEVNGPGEARAADIGIAGGKGIGLIFK